MIPTPVLRGVESREINLLSRLVKSVTAVYLVFFIRLKTAVSQWLLLWLFVGVVASISLFQGDVS